MNDICKTCYSNGKAVARSFNFADIEEKNLIEKQTYTTTTTYSEHYYPLIHKYEEYSNINGLISGNNALSKNVQNKYYSKSEEGATNGYMGPSTISPTNSHPTLSLINTSTTNYFMTFRTEFPYYWLASRYIDFYSNYYATFYIRSMTGSTGDLSRMFDSNKGFSGEKRCLRPIIEIPLNSVEIGNTGVGQSSDPFSLEIK